MRLSASDLYTYYRPSQCDLRVHLRHKGIPEECPGPLEQVLFRLAVRHEKAHLATLPEVLDLSALEREESYSRTAEAVRARAPAIYQGALRARATLNGIPCDIVGEPDFLIKVGEGYVIRDSKLSKRIDHKDHPEIICQLQLYGWLYQQTFRQAPLGLEVHSGSGDIIPIEYDKGKEALRVLAKILNVKQAEQESYSPVGWSKCTGCGFHGRCWDRAKVARDVALVNGVDQGLTRTLRVMNIGTYEQLMTLKESRLAEIERPWGDRMRKVGNRAARMILKQARALATGAEETLHAPAVPRHSNYVVLDLEGLPPYLGELDKVYLWGVRVYGERPGPYQAAVARLGVDGDRQGWQDFLRIARGIFEEYGDVPFTHWSQYEKTKVDVYLDTYGDTPDGTAARVRRNLLDLFAITREALVLPLPSYSLKVVERYIGFKRRLPEANGEWAIARYVEAIETKSPEARGEAMNEIRAYNEEDLEATWAVLQWLRAKKIPSQTPAPDMAYEGRGG